MEVRKDAIRGEVVEATFKAEDEDGNQQAYRIGHTSDGQLAPVALAVPALESGSFRFGTASHSS